MTSKVGVMSGAASLLAAVACAQAGDRLIATGGVTQIEGAAGGGLTPWALIAGYGTRDEIGGSAFFTHLDTGDFRLNAGGAAIGFYDRIELSYARQKFGLGSTVPGETISQDIFGIKLKIAGDAIFAQDSWLPQIAVGVQHKRNRDFDLVPKLLGARHDNGIDFYVAASKLYLAGIGGRNLLINGAVRATKANQFGLLGFGGDKEAGYTPQFEGAAVVFLDDNLAVGAEYRTKPDNLTAFREDDFKDVFIAWLPYKYLALTLAYVGLGNIADKRHQSGPYISLQASY